MSDVYISSIMVYPVKSLAGVALTESKVLSVGLQHDRRWAVVNSNWEIITGREYPALLGISIDIQAQHLLLTASGMPAYQLDLEPPLSKIAAAKLFNRDVRGWVQETEVSEWLSSYLEIDCKLIMLEETGVEMRAKYGAKEGDRVSYADTSPIHLVSEESLHDLNTRLDSPVSFNRFRPNIIIRGAKPYQEDQWKNIRIGDCTFEVNELCKRCVFTTVDPEQQRKDPQQEPLRTLSSYRKNASGAVTFGVNLTPRQLGEIKVGEKLEIISELP